MVITVYGLIHGWWRHFMWASLMLLGVSVLVIMTMVLCDPNGPSLSFFPLGAAVSVCLVWLGNKARLRRPCKSPPDTLLETIVVPVPSAQVIRPEDVLGPWRFYVDAAMSTVTIDLQADGRYRQVIVGNRGEQINCPGGTWTLEAAYLDLASYRSAVRAVTENVRWFFGDWHKDLVLFAKDDPLSETMLQGRKIKAAAI